MSNEVPSASSPLAEASPQSLDELFLRLDAGFTSGGAYADSDLDACVGELRRMRKTWDLTEARAKGKKEAKRELGPGPPTLSLDDLDLT